LKNRKQAQNIKRKKKNKDQENKKFFTVRAEWGIDHREIFKAY